jgi:hypothetical protein
MMVQEVVGFTQIPMNGMEALVVDKVMESLLQ